MNIGTDSLMQNELEEKLIGYKVVYRENSKAFSPATKYALQSIRYRINEETRKKDGEYGPFALFTNLNDAFGFAKGLPHHTAILLVEYEPSKEESLWKKNPPSISRGWHGSVCYQSNGITEKSLGDCPDGTVFADSIYPIEVLKEL